MTRLRIVVALAVFFLCCSSSYAQLVTGYNSLSLVGREDVREELKLSSSVVDVLSDALKDLHSESNEMLQQVTNFKELGEEERKNLMTTLTRKGQAASVKARKLITSNLSGVQLKRFNQLEMQYHLQTGNLIAALQLIDVEMNDTNRERIGKVVRDAKEVIQEEIRKRSAEVSMQLYSKAVADMSQAKMEEVIGEPFAFTFRRNRPLMQQGVSRNSNKDASRLRNASNPNRRPQ